MVLVLLACFCSKSSYNEANEASAKVAPKLSLKATLSSTKDRMLTLVAYRCIRDIGRTLIPWDDSHCVLLVPDKGSCEEGYLNSKDSKAKHQCQCFRKCTDCQSTQYS